MKRKAPEQPRPSPWPMGDVCLAELLPADYNPRKISKRAMAGLEASIARFGLVQPIVINERSAERGWKNGKRTIVGGHQRAKVLAANGVATTRAVIVDLNAEGERGLNLTLNNPNVEGEFTDELQEMLDALSSSDLFAELNLDQLERAAPLDAAGDLFNPEDLGSAPTTFWLVVRGPMPAQADALEQIAKKFRDLDLDVDTGYTW